MSGAELQPPDSDDTHSHGFCKCFLVDFHRFPQRPHPPGKFAVLSRLVAAAPEGARHLQPPRLTRRNGDPRFLGPWDSAPVFLQDVSVDSVARPGRGWSADAHGFLCIRLTATRSS